MRQLCIYLIATAILSGDIGSLVAMDRPNVILMMADDLGWGDPGYNGNPVIKTPNLDQMSRDGIQFNRFYAASAVCSPTRGACLTGRNPNRYGIYSANVGHLPNTEISLAEVLKENGYATGHFGKWHLGTLTSEYSGKGASRQPAKHFSTPGANGFNEWFSTEFAVATWDPYDPKNSHLAGKAYDTRALYWHNGRNVTEPLTGDDSRIIVDRALPFMRRSIESGQPFFAVIWFHAPHEPIVGGPEYRQRYSEYPEDAQHYYACVTALDEQVGRLRTELTRWNAEANTMIWFCSDNGPEGNPAPVRRRRGSAGPFRGRKRSLYEGGIRVPGLLVWPGRIPVSAKIDFPCVTSDFLPTIMDAIGRPVPADRPYDGISLLPVIDGEISERPAPIGFHFGSQSAMSDNRYKLVHNRSKRRLRSDNGNIPISEWELYDLLHDQSETRDIAATQPRIVSRLQQQISDWLVSCQFDDSLTNQ